MQTSRLGYRCLVAFVTILLALTPVFPVLDGTKSAYAQEEAVPAASREQAGPSRPEAARTRALVSPDSAPGDDTGQPGSLPSAASGRDRQLANEYAETLALSWDHGQAASADRSRNPASLAPSQGPAQGVDMGPVDRFEGPVLATGAVGAMAAPLALLDTGVVRVATTGADVLGCGSVISPCLTVQYAVDQALAGDSVLIATGVYTNADMAAETRFVTIGKELTLAGGYTTGNWDTADPVANPTVFDAEGLGTVVYAETAGITVTLSGLTLQRGTSYGVYMSNSRLRMMDSAVISTTSSYGLYLYDSDGSLLQDSRIAGNSGQGVYAYSSDDLVLSGNTITGGGSYAIYLSSYNNRATLSHNTITGNGYPGICIYRYNDYVTLEGNTISGNSGRGVYLSSSSNDYLTLAGNTIAGNSGDGLYFYGATGYVLDNNLITGNSGDGIEWVSGSGTLRHNTFSDNASDSGLKVTSNAALVLTNTIIANQAYGIRTTNVSANVEADHTLWYNNGDDVAAYGGVNIITTNDLYGDPAFVGGADPFAAYHIGAGSAAIDAGVETGLSTDIDGQHRALDIGADEFPYVLNLTPDQQVTTDPDTVVTYTHSLRNSGGVTDTVALTAGSSQGWSLELQPLTVTLGSGAAVSVTLTVTVPPDSSGQADGAVITATSTISPANWTTARDVTLVDLGVQVEPDHSQVATPGSVLTYTHTLTNTGDSADTFALSLSSSLGWAQLVTGSPVALDAGTSAEAVVRVTVPVSAAAGLVDTAVITATSVTVPEVMDTARDETTAGATAGTRYVATTGSDAGNSCLLSAEPCGAVAYAVDQALAGDSVLMASGVYTNPDTAVEGRLVVVDKELTLAGGYSTDNWDTPDPEANPTVLDAEGLGTVVHAETVGITVTLSGLTLQRGTSYGVYMSNSRLLMTDSAVISTTSSYGVYLYYSDGSLLQDSRIAGNSSQGVCAQSSDDLVLTRNTVTGNGYYGISLNSSNNRATLSDNTITGNLNVGLHIYRYNDYVTVEGNTISENGGRGVYLSSSGNDYLTLAGNTIAGNTGDGLYFYGATGYVLDNNLITGNSGDGLEWYSGNGMLRHNTFSDNASESGLKVTYNAALVLTNTIIANQAYGIRTTNVSANVEADHTLWYNNGDDTAAYGGVNIATTNDLHGDPAFVGGADPFAAYHIGAGSAAIDAGVETGLSTDIDGQHRAPDIGADEFPYVLNLAPDQQVTTEPDTVVTYTHSLRNSGGVTDTVALTAGSSQGWSLEVQPLTVTLGSGAAVSVTLTVAVPPGSSGQADRAVITATSTISPANWTTARDVTLVDLGVQVEPDQSQTAASGTVVTYSHTITNSGAISDTFALDLSSSRGWAALATGSPIAIGVGASAEAVVRVTVPLTAAVGVVDTAVITATSVTVPEVVDTARDETTAGATAGTRYVATTGSDAGNSCLLSAEPCGTVGYAVDQALAGDSVLIATGVYTNPDMAVEGRLAVFDKTLTLAGGYTTGNWDTPDPVANPTVLDAEGLGTVVHAETVGITVTLSGLTLQRGTTYGVYMYNSRLLMTDSAVISSTSSYGVYLYDSDGSLLQDSRIAGNSSQGVSAQSSDDLVLNGNTITGNGYYGISLNSSNNGATLSDNTITGNSNAGLYSYRYNDYVTLEGNTISENGGRGVYISSSNNDYLTLVGNTIAGNSGDGLYLYGGTGYALDNNLIAGNSGDGLEWYTGSGVLRHNTLSDNTGDSALRATYNAALVLTNTIISGHVYGIRTSNVLASVEADHTLWYNNGDDVAAYGGVNIITANDLYGDPAFVSGLDPFAAYHISRGSAAIDAGVETGLSTDIDGQHRAPDIGADEFPYALHLIPDQQATTDPDTVVTYTHSLRNSGGVTDTVALTAGSSQGWSLEVQPLTVTLGSGAAVSVTLTVTVPPDSSGQADRAVITATSTISPAVWTTARDVTLVDRGVQLEPDRAQIAAPGSVFTYTHTLSNTGDSADTFALSLSSSLGWAQLVTGSPVALDAGASAEAAVRVTVPLTAAVGLVDTAVITATSVTVPEVMDTARDETTAGATAGTRYVATTGSDAGNSCLLSADPCRTVWYAADQAQAGDSVLMAGGVYTNPDMAVEGRLVVVDKTLTLAGGYSTDNWDTPDPEVNPTVLDAEGLGTVLHAETVGITVTVSGLTLQRGTSYGVYMDNSRLLMTDSGVISTTSSYGVYLGNSDGSLVQDSRIAGTSSYGLYAYSSDDLVLSGNTITGNASYAVYLNSSNNRATFSDNTITGSGSYAVYLSSYNDWVTFSHNTITGNSSVGIYLYRYNDYVTLEGNTISENGSRGVYFASSSNDYLTVVGNTIAGNAADGLYLYGGADYVLDNNLIAGNSGDGIEWVSGSGTLRHNTLSDNTGDSALRVTSNAALVLTNTIISGHTCGILTTYSSANVQADHTLWFGNGSDMDSTAGGTITTTNDRFGDPSFAGGADPFEAYHIDATSAAVDTGVDAGLYTDIDGQSRPYDTGFDIGADEYPGQAVPPADLVIAGPLTGTIQFEHTFTATVNLITTTLPITYQWEVEGQPSIVHVGNRSDSATFVWHTPGPQVVTVLATNEGGTITATHPITIAAPPAASLPFYDGFESGTLGESWLAVTQEQGRVQVGTYAPYAGSYGVLLDDAVNDSVYSTASLVLTIDLAGQPSAVLDFWWREFGDENHAQDGVFVSDDYGATWHQAFSFNNGPSTYRQDLVDLGAAAAAHGLAFTDHFQIKFQFYDDLPIPYDGYAIDDVRVVPATPVEGVTITGPTDGVANATYVFTATISPITATPPILYAWHATDQVPITHTTGISDQVAFTWTLSGTKAITLTATNAASTVTGTHAIAVDAPAIISLAPDTIEETLAAGAVHTASLTISNTGGSLLTWSGVTSEPGWSTIDPGGGDVLPGQTSPVTVALDAGALVSGTYNADLEFQSNDPVTPLITVPVTLHVVGEPSAVITPTLLDFGDVFVGYTHTLQIEIENAGAAELIVSEILASDPDLSVSPTSLSVLPLGVQAVDVAYTPSALGPFTGTLTLSTNDPITSVRTVDVVATAVHSPAISAQPASFDVSQDAGLVSTRALSITNSGLGTLEYDLSLDTGVVAVEPLGGSLEGPGQSPITVTFDTTALAEGTYHDQIWVASNDPVTPLLTIPVTLTVTLVPPEAPANPDPQDGETDVPVDQVLSWQASLHATSYDLYLWEEGQTKPITPTASGLAQPSYDPPGDLSMGTTFQWQVVARNAAGETPGPEWTFVTPYLSDLMVTGIDIAPAVYAAGEVVAFTAVVSNADLGGAVGSFYVRFAVDGVFVGRQIVAGLDTGEALDVVQTWAATPRAGIVTVIVDEFNAVEEQDENNNQLTEALPATLAPDLVVMDVAWSPEGIDDGEQIMLSATVMNSSTIDASQSFKVRFEIDGVYLGSQQISELAWGETAVVSQAWNATVGSHTVVARADEWNSVDEADEDNNARTQSLPEVVAADLFVDSIDWSPPANIADGDIVSFTAVISNAGPGSTLRSSYVRFEVDGALIGRAQIAGIEAGQSAEATLAWAAVAGSITVRAVADEYDTVTETSEVNNDLDESLPAIHMPDLTASNLSWSPTESIQDGDKVTITVTVENIGDGDTSRNFGVRFEVGGASIGSPQVSSLDAGSSVDVSQTWIAEPGDHLVRVVVDEDNVVRESEEGNNEVSQEPLEVLVPDLTVADVAWSPAQISDGTEVSFAATISNTGSGDISSSFHVGFELDGDNIGWEQVSGGLAVNASTTITLSQPWIAPNGQHTVTVTADLFGAITEISETNNHLSETLGVVDGNAPVLVSISPADGAVSNDVYTVTATLSDDLGQGVDIGQCALELTLDGAVISGTQAFPGSNQIALVPDEPLEEGDYEVEILAVDLQGNSAPYQTLFAVDMTPPLIEVTGVSDGASYETCITPTVAITDLHLSTVSLALNGYAFASGTPILADGEYALAVLAADEATNITSELFNFTVDAAPAPPTGLRSVQQGNAVELSWNANLEADLDGYNVYRDSALLNTGLVSDTTYTDPDSPPGSLYQVTAVDLAGHESAPAEVALIHSALLTYGTQVEGLSYLTLGYADAFQIGISNTATATVQIDSLDLQLIDRFGNVHTEISRAPLSLPAGASEQVDEKFLIDDELTELRVVMEASGSVVVDRFPLNLRTVQEGPLAVSMPSLREGYADELTLSFTNHGSAQLRINPQEIGLDLKDLDGTLLSEGGAVGTWVLVEPQATIDIGAVITTPLMTDLELELAVTMPSYYLASSGQQPGSEYTTDASAAVQYQAVSPVSIQHGTLTRGGVGQFSLAFFNQGTADLLSGAGDVEVNIRDTDGNLLAQGSSELVGLTDAGTTSEFLVEVSLPPDLPDWVEIEGLVRGSSLLLPDIGVRLSARSLAQAIEPPYNATANTDSAIYHRGEVVTISGLATSTGDGSPVPHAEVRITVSSKGFTRQFAATADASGQYTYAFRPLATEAGRYNVGATHPVVTSLEVDAQFEILGLFLSPKSVSVEMSQNSTTSYEAQLRNLGESPLTGILMDVIDGDGGDEVTASVAPGPFDLQPGQSLNVSVQVSAGPNAPPEALLEIQATAAQGSVETSALVVLAQPAEPVAGFVPPFIETGMNPGSVRVEQVSVENIGYGTMEDVVVGDPSLPWVSITSDPDLGAVGPGESKTFDILINPGEDVAPGVYEDMIEVTSSNHQTLVFDLRVYLTASATGDLHFVVTNHLGESIPGAEISIADQDTYTLLFSAEADANGEATLTGIPVGRYSYKVIAPFHSQEVGTALVEAGVETEVLVQAVYSFLLVEWEVTPIVIADRYVVTHEITYDTQAPVPYIEVRPDVVPLYMLPGASYQGEIVLTNKSEVVSAFEGEPWAEVSDPGLTIEFLVDEIPEILPGESITVPYVVRLPEHFSPVPSPCDDYHLAIHVSWKTVCAFGVYYEGVWDHNVYVTVPTDSVSIPIKPACVDAIADLAGCALDIMGGALPSVIELPLKIKGCIDTGAGCAQMDMCDLGWDIADCVVGVYSCLGGPYDSCVSAALNLAKCMFQDGCCPDEPPSSSGVPDWDWDIGVISGIPIWDGGTLGDPSPWTAGPCVGASEALAERSTSAELPSAIDEDTMCVRVKLEVLQEVTLERQGFDAALSLGNIWPDDPMTGVSVTIDIRDEAGNPANDLFFVSVTSLEGIDSIQDGTLAPEAIGTAHWLIVPVPGAGGTSPEGKRYSLSATIDYNILGTAYFYDTWSDVITVEPMPLLVLDYMLPRYVYGDDLLTVGIHEPVIPFKWGVRVQNIGYGPATNLAIDSSQPEIVEATAGVHLSFDLLGAWVDGEVTENTLKIDFGDVAPATCTTAGWEMAVSASGEFSEYEATFSHDDALGGEATSLLQDVQTNVLVKEFMDDRPGQDTMFDFLVDTDEDDVPDLIVDSACADGTIRQIPATLLAAPSPEDPTAVLQAGENAPGEWVYMAVDVYLTDYYDLVLTTRSDGKILDPANQWLREGKLHIVDYDVVAGMEYTTMMELKLDGGVVLSGDSERIGVPGTTLTHTFTLTNTGDETDAYVLTLDGFQWPTTSALTRTADLAAGQSVEIHVNVETPSDLGGSLIVSDVFTLTATSVLDVRAQDSSAGTTIANNEPITGLVALNDSPTVLGSATTLTATIGAGINVTFTWAFGDEELGAGAVVTHTYPATGIYTAVVTATNPVNVVTATTTVTITPSFEPPITVTIGGPTVGTVESSQAFTATVVPTSTTQPLTYTWWTATHDPVIHAAGLSDTITFTWSTSGTQPITVTATNAGGTVTGTHAIMICPYGDLDYDCDVDVVDIMLVVTRWNTQTGDPEYDPAYDLDDDGDIDIVDIMAVAAEWGATCGGLDEGADRSPSTSGGPELSLLPPESYILPGEAITYTLVISGVEDLGAYQMDIVWDPLAVTLESMEPLAMLDEGGNTVVDLGPLAGDGRLTFGAFGFGDGPGASGEGALALLTFRRLVEAETLVSVGNVRLVDMEGQEIEAGSVSGAALAPPWISLYLPLILK